MRATWDWQPRSKQWRLNFSLGAWGRSSGRPKPTMSDSRLRADLRVPTMGMVAPSRTRTGGRPQASATAWTAAASQGESVGTAAG